MQVFKGSIEDRLENYSVPNAVGLPNVKTDVSTPMVTPRGYGAELA
jgi:hypothetical protein